ncbi:MAG: TonB-dependent receptor [Bacteroidaceae bacterium]|nr:TonB-dependent receptor [Bacteroidaceae bacterium]
MMKQVNIRIPLRILALVCGLFISLGAFAQIQVKGNVKDDTGEPVMGATIRVIGQEGGTVSDFDGNFVISAPQGSELTISFMGFATQTVPARPVVNVTLQEDSKVLDDVIVIGYGTVKKNDLTGAVTAIKPDEKNHGLVVNAQDMIQGKIAGVNVTSGGGTPGGGASIRIRGGSSLNASNDPLIVIDGLAMDNQGVKGLANPLSMVNPQDIESFTVLKDASATAIYGSRGSNGVIIITTKKGSKGQKPQVSYNGNVSYSMKTKTLDVLGADAYRNFINSYYGADSKAAGLMGTANTDWQDQIYTGAFGTDHNVTVAGGAKHMPYRVTVGYTDQNGILKTSNFQRTTASVALNPSFLDDHLTFNINGKFMYAYNRYANTDAINDAVRMDPTQPVYFGDPDDNYHGYFAWQADGSAYKDPSYPTIINTYAGSNPVARLNEKDDRANSFDYMGNVEVDYKIHGLEDLRLHMNFSGDWGNGKQNTAFQPWGPSNFYYGNDGYTKENKYNLIYSAYAQYYKDFNEKHHFDVMGGYEWSHKKYWGESDYTGYYPLTSQITDEETGEALAGTKYKPSFGEWKQESYLVSFYGRANYILLNRYMFTGTVRYDGSSRFKDHWALFPSAAFAWRVSEEPFLRNAKNLDDLKVRLGWGKTGQQDGIGNYNYFASYNVNINNTDGRYPIKGVNDSGLLYRPDAYNEDLKWETTTTYNAGIDFSFFKNRLSGSIDGYYRKTTDLINTAYVSAGSNFRNQVLSNIGSLENKGVEVMLTVRPVVTKDWLWEVTGNFTYNHNEITELTGESSIVPAGGISSGTGNMVQAQAVGHPANSFYVYQQVYDQNGLPVEGCFVDRDGDGKISESDRYFYKSPHAPYLAGLSTRLQYKNWDLGLGFRASFNNYIYWDKQAGYANTAKRYDSSFNYLQTSIPSAIANDWSTYDYVVSDYFVHNATFLKCDNITLGYSFNTDDNFLRGRAYIAATNVFTVTKYKGVDPEVFGGIDNSIYPRPFTIQLGVALDF